MSQVDIIWKVSGQELELDLQDAETAVKYEEAFEKMGEAEKSLPKDGKSSQYIVSYCQLFVDLFDSIFEPGVGRKILGPKSNARIATEIYQEFLAFVAAQKNASLDVKNDIIARYSMNRAQRRAQGTDKP